MEMNRPSLSSLLKSRVASAMRRATGGDADPAASDGLRIDEGVAIDAGLAIDESLSAAEIETSEVPETASSKERLTYGELAEAAQRFSLILDAATGGDEIRSLWGNASLPYDMTAEDPRSAEYKQEVLDLFKKLSGRDYDSSCVISPTTPLERDFGIDYPWMSRDLSAAAAELAKPVQVLQAFAAAGKIQHVVTFGSGWGDLAMPLAKIGLQVTAIDTDKASLDRLSACAERQKVQLETVHGEFLECASRLHKIYDAVVFQSAFQHCLEFDALLREVRASILKPDGCIYFFGEPVFKDYGFPWGLRYDGKSLWAIMKNHSLELGYDKDFFITLLNGHGYTVSAVPGIPGLLGPGWQANPSSIALPFNQVALPSRYEAGFFQSDRMQSFRFCKAAASLPGEFGLGEGAQCEIHFTNILPVAVNAEILAGGVTETVQLQPHSSKSILTSPKGGDIIIKSQTFIPDIMVGNGDTRKLGIGIERVSWNSAAAANPDEATAS